MSETFKWQSLAASWTIVASSINNGADISMGKDNPEGLRKMVDSDDNLTQQNTQSLSFVYNLLLWQDLRLKYAVFAQKESLTFSVPLSKYFVPVC